MQPVTIPTLSLCQPYASLIAVGAKPIETRSWLTHYRGPLAIHASALVPTDYRDHCDNDYIAGPLLDAGILASDSILPRWRQLQCGVVLAIVDLVECWRFTRAESYEFPSGRRVELTDADYDRGSIYPDRCGWLLENIRPLPQPIEAKGRQGLWRWEVPAELLPLLEGGQP